MIVGNRKIFKKTLNFDRICHYFNASVSSVHLLQL